MNQKGFFQIFFILIVIAGIGMTVYLTQFTQVFKPKANSINNEFYVSPLGNDANDGSTNLPFKTIDRARQEVRKINKTTVSDIFVYIKNGIYNLDAPLVFNSEDSGFNDHYVRYISESPSVRPLISGGKIITGWAQSGNMWRTNIGDFPIRQLYINGQRGVRARDESGLGQFQTTADGLVYSDDRISKLQNPGAIEVVINNSPYEKTVLE